MEVIQVTIEQKKFMDYTGTSHLWSKIKNELANKAGTITAGGGIEVTGTTAAPTVAIKLSAKAGNALSIESGSGEQGLYVNVPSGDAYNIVKDTTDNSFAAVYHLTKNGTNQGAAIEIPKDMVVSSGTVETKSESGAWGNAGTYIKLVLANATNDTIYIPVDSLIEYVTSGSGQNDMVVIAVDSSTHQVTATITDGTITKAKLASAVQTSLNNADSALQAADITEGATNGTISVDGSDVAVHGLGTAAYASTTDFDAAGDATAVYQAIIAMTTSEIDAAIAAANAQS